MLMSKIAIVAALEREVNPLIKSWKRVERQQEGSRLVFFERGDAVLVCGGIGVLAARRAAEAIIANYHPARLYSVGFAGALDPTLRVGDLFSPSLLLDARNGSRTRLSGSDGSLITFMEVASIDQKTKLAQAYGARAVDMEAAAVAESADAYGITFAIMKVISDELDFEIPGMASFIGSEGRFRTGKFISYVALRPWLWWRVSLLARNSSKAAKILSRHLASLCNPAAVASPTAPSVVLPSRSSK